MDTDIRQYNKIDKLCTELNCTNRIISIIGTVLGLIITVFIFAINFQFNALEKSTSSKFELIQQQLGFQKEINSLQIQKEFAEFNVQNNKNNKSNIKTKLHTP